ncbi:hypothetical protein, partial [Rubinisphaera sp.]|uniref:hypothetical protein n=1 Tax=Rubinisphaera sp. TaxID=2024857 RepID=UPI0025F571BD
MICLYAAQPPSELVQHQSSSEVGRVDGGLGRAGTCLGLGLREQGGRVVSLGWQVGGRENTDDFAEHAAIAPELCLVFDGFPDRRAIADGIDAA